MASSASSANPKQNSEVRTSQANLDIYNKLHNVDPSAPHEIIGMCLVELVYRRDQKRDNPSHHQRKNPSARQAGIVAAEEGKNDSDVKVSRIRCLVRKLQVLNYKMIEQTEGETWPEAIICKEELLVSLGDVLQAVNSSSTRWVRCRQKLSRRYLLL